jgi:hypothetical protein
MNILVYEDSMILHTFHFIFCLFVLPRTSREMLNRGGESGCFCLISGLWVKHSPFDYVSGISSGLFIDVFSHVEEASFYE